MRVQQFRKSLGGGFGGGRGCGHDGSGSHDGGGSVVVVVAVLLSSSSAIRMEGLRSVDAHNDCDRDADVDVGLGTVTDLCGFLLL